MKKPSIYRIDKIKMNQERVHIEYSVHRKDEMYDEYVVDTIDQPLQSFRQALFALTTCVTEICALHEKYDEGMRITGVSFSWANDIMGVIITAYKELKDLGLGFVFNTPHLPEMPYRKGSSQAILTDGQAKKLHNVIKEAVKFLDGERAQTELFEGKVDAQKHDKSQAA